MMHAVSGTQRAWLIFSGLSFVLCGALLLVRFARSSPSSADRATAPAASAAVAPAISDEFTLPAKAGPATKESADRAAGSSRDAIRAEPGSAPTSDPSNPKAAPAKSAKKKVASHKGAAGRGSGDRGVALEDDFDRAPAAPPPPPPLTKAPPRKAPTAASPPPPPPANPPPGALGGSKSARGKQKHRRPAPDEAKKEGGTEPEARAEAPAEKLVEGVLRVNAPPSMLVGESEHIRAVVGTKPRVAQVDKDAAAEVGDGPRVQIGRELMLSPLVRMELKADVPGDFDITAFAPQAEQRLTDSDTTVWDWAVQPKKEGLRGLTLVVTDLKEPSREPIHTKIYPVHILVRVATIQKVHDVAVSVSSLLSGLAGLIGAWMGILRPALQRRREGEGGGGAPRPPLAGSAPPRPAPGHSLRPEIDPPAAEAPPQQ